MVELSKQECELFKVFLKKIRWKQDNQKQNGERPWSMGYISVDLCNLTWREELKRHISTPQAHAIAHELKKKGLVRFKRYRYKGTFLFLTEKGIEFVKGLKK